MAEDLIKEQVFYDVLAAGRDHDIVQNGTRKVIVEWIWEKAYEYGFTREHFFMSVMILDYIVTSIELKEPSGPPTLLGAAAFVTAASLVVQ